MAVLKVLIDQLARRFLEKRSLQLFISTKRPHQDSERQSKGNRKNQNQKVSSPSRIVTWANAHPFIFFTP